MQSSLADVHSNQSHYLSYNSGYNAGKKIEKKGEVAGSKGEKSKERRKRESKTRRDRIAKVRTERKGSEHKNDEIRNLRTCYTACCVLYFNEIDRQNNWLGRYSFREARSKAVRKTK